MNYMYIQVYYIIIHEMYCTWFWAWVASLASGSRNACKSLTVLYIHWSMRRRRRFREDVLVLKPGVCLCLSLESVGNMHCHRRSTQEQCGNGEQFLR